MTDNLHKILVKTGWALFVTFLFLNLINWGFTIKDDFFVRTLPFDIENGKAVDFSDSTLVDILQDVIITKIDTLILPEQEETYQVREDSRSINIQMPNWDVGASNLNEQSLENRIRQTIGKRHEIEINYADSVNTQSIMVQTVLIKDYTILINMGFNAIFLLFIFFNSFLLLKFSLAKENILIILFLLFLSSPDSISGLSFISNFSNALMGFLGVLFYHFILEKVKLEKRVKHIYLIAVLLIIICQIIDSIFSFPIQVILYIWSLYWMFAGFVMLWKAFKKTGSITLKRLLNAFRGIFISLVSLIFVIILAAILGFYYGASDSVQFVGINNIQTAVLVIMILITLLAFFIFFMQMR